MGNGLKKPGHNSTFTIGGFRAPQTHLWLIKVWFSASTFVLKIATFAKPETVIGHQRTDNIIDY
jgi:hypothetical protein